MRLRLRHAVVPLALALALTACGRPGTAATVDGVRITDAQLAETSADLAALGLPAETEQTLASLIVAGPVLRTAAELGVGASEEQGTQLLDSFAVRNQVEPFEYSRGAIDIARANVIALEATPQEAVAIQEAALNMEATVNPRFGSFTAGQGMTAPQWSWLVSGTDVPTTTVD